MKKFNWGILGVGKDASQFAAQFDDDNAKLLAVASHTLQEAYTFAGQHNLKKAYGTFEELTFDPEIDILYISASIHTQYEQLLIALKAGKHVYSSKPLSLTKQQLDIVKARSKTKELLIVEVHTQSQKPHYKDFPVFIESGRYGLLKIIRASTDKTP